jgi:thiamine-phosphate pyrophosphorylase
MASRGQPSEPRRPAARLYLVIPQHLAGHADLLAQTLGAADVAAVLLPLPQADQRRQIDQVKAVAPAVQERGVALLLAGHPDLAAPTGADGAHLHGIEALTAALPTLKPARIAGCGGLATRHDAMLAGEAGTDYVMFGEPEPSGHRPSFDAIIERVAWWAQLFEIPCVGFAASLDEVDPLAGAGADFVAVGDWVFADGRGCAAAVADAAQRLAVAEPVA